MHQQLINIEWALLWCEVAFRSLWRRRNAAIEPYAATSCLELLSKVATLSRELRDIIYDYLLELDNELIKSTTTHISDKVSEYDRQPPWRGPTWMPKTVKMPHYLDVDYMDLTIISEIKRCLPKQMAKTQSFAYNVLNISQLRSQTLQDQCLNLPIHAFIQNIKIDMSLALTLATFQGVKTANDEVFRTVNNTEPSWSTLKALLVKHFSRNLRQLKVRGARVVLVVPHSTWYHFGNFSKWREEEHERLMQQFRCVLEDVARELRSLDFKDVQVSES